MSQNGNLPQIGVKINNIWNHHLVFFSGSTPWIFLQLRVCRLYIEFGFSGHPWGRISRWPWFFSLVNSGVFPCLFFPDQKHMMETKQIINPPKKHRTLVFLVFPLGYPPKSWSSKASIIWKTRLHLGGDLTGHHCGVEGGEVTKITRSFSTKVGYVYQPQMGWNNSPIMDLIDG